LASYSAEQRTKEIGIRKILGASVSNIVLLLSKEFTRWALLANIIAWPLAYAIMRGWLQNFAYRAGIGLGTFLLTAILTFLIALVSVGFQSLRAALADPVKSLRYE
jgi:putative ABC transport system permease protein